jgi:hypothetical protein
MFAAALAALAALGGDWVPAVALADGDPASDVLVTQPLFLPGDADVSTRVEAQLTGLLTSAQRAGAPIRVAVIASAADLGSVTALWPQAQNYARFLGVELSLVYRGTLLVVMPDGDGLATVGRTAAPPPAVLAGASRPGPGAALGTAALSAVQRLTSAAGLHLAVPDAAPAAVPGSSDPVAWAVLAAGAALIALAWGASARAKPLSLPGRPRET